MDYHQRERLEYLESRHRLLTPEEAIELYNLYVVRDGEEEYETDLDADEDISNEEGNYIEVASVHPDEIEIENLDFVADDAASLNDATVSQDIDILSIRNKKLQIYNLFHLGREHCK